MAKVVDAGIVEFAQTQNEPDQSYAPSIAEWLGMGEDEYRELLAGFANIKNKKDNDFDKIMPIFDLKKIDYRNIQYNPGFDPYHQDKIIINYFKDLTTLDKHDKIIIKEIKPKKLEITPQNQSINQRVVNHQFYQNL